MHAIQGCMARMSEGGSPPVLEWASTKACADPVGPGSPRECDRSAFEQHKLQNFVSAMYQELSWCVDVLDSAL